MIEIRFHGRGGQGTVVASEIMADSVFLEGRYSQSFPAFGVERRGAPVTAFLRVDNKPIRIRTEIYEPDHLVVLDPLLVDQISLEKGLKPTVIPDKVIPVENYLCLQGRFKHLTDKDIEVFQRQMDAKFERLKEKFRRS